jgi:DNA-binding response OmpR family regulator
MMAKTMPPRLLVVDQDTRYAEWLKHHLSVLCPESPVTVVQLTDFEQRSETVSGRDCDILMLAASFGSSPEDPNARGLELLRQWRDKSHFPVVIAVAEDGNELTAVRSLQLGAVDYLPKRLLTPERLKTTVRLALRMIEKRVARRIASLAYTSDGGTQSVVLPAQMAIVAHTPVAADAAPKVSAEGPGAASANALPDPAPSIQQPTGPGTPLPPAKAPGGEFMSANFIPGYTIHATIGESEKAAVYVATSATLNTNVALKVSKTLRDEAAGRQFLEREYTAIAAIRHPSVVQIYDYGVHAGYEYLVMEYLPRGDLKARMQQPLSEQETLRYVTQIAAALQIVHRAGLLHRDLKPPNVMLRDNGDVALIDFGLARALDGSTPSTRTGVLRGSPYYMSPEQALGEVLDARSDFYSLGIMFYEMLTGKKPYMGGSAMDVLQQHVHAPVPMLPKPLVQHEPLLLKLMAKSRVDRFNSAEEILVTLAAAGEPNQSTPRDAVHVESSAA